MPMNHDLSAEDFALAYKQSIRVEEAWRTMKSTIEIGGVPPDKSERIRAHASSASWRFLWNGPRSRHVASPAPDSRGTSSIKVGQLLGPQGTVLQTTPEIASPVTL